MIPLTDAAGRRRLIDSLGHHRAHQACLSAILMIATPQHGRIFVTRGVLDTIMIAKHRNRRRARNDINEEPALDDAKRYISNARALSE